ncbi:MAG: DUF177 domain-containing protein [Anaerolineae bacterium]|nr:DUF177 domain-containing protein [Anaerolineae bacterium]
MRYNVAQLLKAPVGTRREYELSEDIRGLDEDLKALEPLTGHLKLTRTASGILVTGRLHTVVTIECRRCVQEFTSPVDFEVEEEFVPTVDIQTGAGLPTGGLEAALLIDERHMLDLSEVVRQYIVLHREQYPLCDEACAGLCPVCGANLNEGPCGCQDVSGDPRWGALRELLEGEQ